MSSEVSNDSTSILHKIYTSDPILYKSYVNKKVTITTEDSNVHIGFVYTIDPVSESIVLMQPKEGEEKMQLKIIMRGAIKKFECSFDNEFLLPEMFVAPEIHMPEEELMKRKYSVVKLLLENHFPVSEDKGNLYIKDTLEIRPPFGPDNCICLNSIILNRIQTLLRHASF